MENKPRQDPEKVISNFSKVSLTELERSLLVSERFKFSFTT